MNDPHEELEDLETEAGADVRGGTSRTVERVYGEAKRLVEDGPERP